MENPGTSLFQGADINLNNSQNNEEEEDLEDQMRRQEELQNLLMAKLDDFNYDESTVTINSSTNTSGASAIDVQSKYREATEPNEQLKVLYDVRIRELKTLKDTFDNYKKEKIKEVEDLKKKLIISEAEINQLKISLKSSESLLVEKTSIINELRSNLNNRDEQIQSNKKTIEDFHIEIAAYQANLKELQLKNHMDNNPFCLGNKKFNSEELQRAHEEQINHLETLLNEQTRVTEQFEKEKCVLQEELQKLIQVDSVNRNTINALTNNFDGAQKQCAELIGVVEMLTNENCQLQERIQCYYQNVLQDSNPRKMENTPNGHIEKLKKMLLDKSMHIDTLNLKLENYENNIKELLEYRQLKNDIYKKEFQQCDSKEHTTDLLLMQNDLQNYKRVLDDKNQQILALNTNNKELLKRMEDMISQTRNDIQNFSYKYNMPQLEKMAEDLKAAEETIKELEEKVKTYEEEKTRLMLNLQKSDMDKENALEREVIELKLSIEKQSSAFKEQITKLETDLSISSNKIAKLEQINNDLMNHNEKLKMDLKNDCIEKNQDGQDFFKKQYLEAIQKLYETQNKVKKLEEMMEERTHANVLIESEKCAYEVQIKNYENKLCNMQKSINTLQGDLQIFKELVQEKEKVIINLQENHNLHIVDELNKDIACKDTAINVYESNKKELEELLHIANTELGVAKKEVQVLQEMLNEIKEKPVRRNLEKDLKEIENGVEQHKRENEEVEILKVELKIREELQEEYLKKLRDVEKKYQQASTSGKDLYKEQADKLKNQEMRHRNQLTNILTECAQKIKELQDDKHNLTMRIKTLQVELDKLGAHIVATEESYKQILKDTRTEGEKNVEEWKKWSKKFLSNCLKIESTNKTTRDNILIKMKSVDLEVAAIEKMYNDKIKKYVKNCKV